MFTARRLDILADSSLKIYHYRTRAYDPDTGRFLQTDPIGYADSMNLYEYVAGNPTNYIDPWGLRLRARDNELVMVMGNTSVFMGIRIEESRAVPEWTWSDGVSYTMTWRDAGILWFNNEVGFDKFNYQKYDAVKEHLLTKIKNANTVKDIETWVTAFEMSCNIVPFFDASYKLVEEGDPTGALVSAGIESALYVVAWAGGKAIKCFTSCADDVARVTDDIAKGADDLGKGADDAAKLVDETAELTGQDHHAISKKVHRQLDETRNLKGKYKLRDQRFTTRARDLPSHNGYQRWHRQLDDDVVNWLRQNREATPLQFEKYMQNRYAKPDLRARFPNGMRKK